MKRSRFSEAQIAFVLRQANEGVSWEQITGPHQFSSQDCTETFQSGGGGLATRPAREPRERHFTCSSQTRRELTSVRKRVTGS